MGRGRGQWREMEGKWREKVGKCCRPYRKWRENGGKMEEKDGKILAGWWRGILDLSCDCGAPSAGPVLDPQAGYRAGLHAKLHALKGPLPRVSFCRKREEYRAPCSYCACCGSCSRRGSKRAATCVRASTLQSTTSRSRRTWRAATRRLRGWTPSSRTSPSSASATWDQGQKLPARELIN
eukprot:gene14447-biopygen18635